MKTSAHFAMRSITLAEAGDLRSSATPRLFRLFRCHMYGYLDCGCGGILFPILHISPLGGSTLITSAPKSDRITAAPGPATKLEKSTTFRPEKMLSVVIGVSLSCRERSRAQCLLQAGLPPAGGCREPMEKTLANLGAIDLVQHLVPSA